MTATAQSFDIERSLRRVAVGYRVLSTVWLLTLGVTRLVTADVRERLWVVVLTMVVAVGWTGITLWLNASRPDTLRKWPFLVADATISIATYFAAIPARTPDFAGGYPIGALVFTVYGAGAMASLVVAGGLIAVAIAALVARSAASTSLVVTQVFFFVFVWTAAAWIVRALRQTEEVRLRIEGELAEVRARQVRAEERTEMAAALHDSVLQTLALVQRRADDADEVRSLARTQERDLRAELFGVTDQGRGFSEAVRAMTAEVEDLHRVKVDTVIVGEAELDDDLLALVAAAREAVVNAAKHAGVESVSVYGELTPERAVVYVRDRGAGFDTVKTVSGAGVAESIIGRMQRRGGTARLQSTLGEGTEVELCIDRSAK